MFDTMQLPITSWPNPLTHSPCRRCEIKIRSPGFGSQAPARASDEKRWKRRRRQEAQILFFPVVLRINKHVDNNTQMSSMVMSLNPGTLGTLK